MRILISAGEASGEMYGAQLIEAMRRRVATGAFPLQNQQFEFFGVGGERMRTAGCDTVVDAKDLAVVGITEILNHLPKIYGLFHKLIAEADRRRPDLAIVIDSPAFNWRVARQMHKRGIPVVYYVCPQFWAWRQGRVRLLRKYVTKALVIFPFEEKFYRDRGVDATFVGHPLADLPKPEIRREEYAMQHDLDSAKPWITLMPGSRPKEVKMNLPEMLHAADLLGKEYEFVLPVAATISRELILRMTKRDEGSASVHLVPGALPVLVHSRAGIIASGTATVEAALMGMPFVMVYRVTPLTYALGRPRVKVPYFAMVNLIAGKEVVPELVQRNFTAQKIVAQIHKILPGGLPRQRMLEDLASVRGALLGTHIPETHAADKAADIILQMLATERTVAHTQP